MKKITIESGYEVLVDDEDYERLNQHKWKKAGKYAWRKVWMHRDLADTPKHMLCDHINGNPLDNRKQNLRNCTSKGNSTNRRKLNQYKYTSKYKGVSRSKGQKVWRARIKNNRKQSFIGAFKQEHHAAIAYDMWAIALWGEYAKTNFPVVAFK